jgi:Transglutaminase-like superfamily
MQASLLLSQLSCLSAEELFSLVRFKFQIAAIRLALRCTAIAKVERWSTRSICPAAENVDPPCEAGVRQRVRLVDLAARRGPVKGSCLVRSIVLKRALAEIGLKSELRIGVDTKTKSEFAAHAWLELNGQPINDRADIHEHFAAFEKTSRATREKSMHRAFNR